MDIGLNAYQFFSKPTRSKADIRESLIARTTLSLQAGATLKTEKGLKLIPYFPFMLYSYSFTNIRESRESWVALQCLCGVQKCLQGNHKGIMGITYFLRLYTTH